MATQPALYRNNTENLVYINKVNRGLSIVYQQQLKVYVIPGETTENTVRGLERFPADNIIFYPVNICMPSSDTFPDIPVEGAEVEEGMLVALTNGNISVDAFDPMMVKKRNVGDVAGMTHMFTAVMCAMAFRHYSGFSLFRYVPTFFVPPGSDWESINDEAVSEYANAVSRVVYCEILTSVLAYGAIVHVTTTYPRRSIITVIVNGTEEKTTEDDKRAAVNQAISRWEQIRRVLAKRGKGNRCRSQYKEIEPIGPVFR